MRAQPVAVARARAARVRGAVVLDREHVALGVRRIDDREIEPVRPAADGVVHRPAALGQRARDRLGDRARRLAVARPADAARDLDRGGERGVGGVVASPGSAGVRSIAKRCGGLIEHERRRDHELLARAGQRDREMRGRDVGRAGVEHDDVALEAVRGVDRSHDERLGGVGRQCGVDRRIGAARGVDRVLDRMRVRARQRDHRERARALDRIAQARDDLGRGGDEIAVAPREAELGRRVRRGQHLHAVGVEPRPGELRTDRRGGCGSGRSAPRGQPRGERVGERAGIARGRQQVRIADEDRRVGTRERADRVRGRQRGRPRRR